MNLDCRGDHGFDSPYVPIGFALAACCFLASAWVFFALSLPWLSVLAFAAVVLFALSAASFLWTTRRGKFLVWSELLDGIGLKGDETLLDVGCGRGAVLVLAAKRLPRGRVVGLDRWSKTDQSGNSETATLRNVEREDVADRVELRTGDMRNLPFRDLSFDAVTSSLAIHNIPDPAGRGHAVAEIFRVLKPGGTALLADIRHTEDYQSRLQAEPGAVVERRSLGWRFWYGGPQVATHVVICHKT
jgi:arsenite methyltransferase